MIERNGGFDSGSQRWLDLNPGLGHVFVVSRFFGRLGPRGATGEDPPFGLKDLQKLHLYHGSHRLLHLHIDHVRRTTLTTFVFTERSPSEPNTNRIVIDARGGSLGLHVDHRRAAL